MAKAMDFIDVFKVLLEGGYIVEIFPSGPGCVKFSVHTSGKHWNPAVGHITEKQHAALCKKNIIHFSGREAKDKYGNIYCYYVLVKEGQHENS